MFIDGWLAETQRGTQCSEVFPVRMPPREDVLGLIAEAAGLADRIQFERALFRYVLHLPRGERVDFLPELLHRLQTLPAPSQLMVERLQNAFSVEFSEDLHLRIDNDSEGSGINNHIKGNCVPLGSTA